MLITPKMISRKKRIEKSEAVAGVVGKTRGPDRRHEDDSARERVRESGNIGVEADRTRIGDTRGRVRRADRKNRRRKAAEGTIRVAEGVRRSIGDARVPGADRGRRIETITKGKEAEAVAGVRKIEKVRVIDGRVRRARLAQVRGSLLGKLLLMRK